MILIIFTAFPIGDIVQLASYDNIPSYSKFFWYLIICRHLHSYSVDREGATEVRCSLLNLDICVSMCFSSYYFFLPFIFLHIISFFLLSFFRSLLTAYLLTFFYFFLFIISSLHIYVFIAFDLICSLLLAAVGRWCSIYRNIGGRERSVMDTYQWRQQVERIGQTVHDERMRMKVELLMIGIGMSEGV